MVILVAVGLAFTSQALKERQKNNENIDKMQQILSSVNIKVNTKDAQNVYNQHIKEAFLVNYQGNKIEGSDGIGVKDPAFQTEFSKTIREKENGQFPVFVADIDGQTKYILGMSGAGLWGPLWGYVSLNQDRSTIFGIDFSHASETPGLGAKITEDWFKEHFKGKHIFMENSFSPVIVKKNASALPNGVDAISGSTLTSNGVNNMIEHSMEMYKQFLLAKN